MMSDGALGVYRRHRTSTHECLSDLISSIGRGPAFCKHPMSSNLGSPVWGLIADVHGNFPALEEALRVLGQAGASRVGFLGDYLGRGDNERCVQRIRDVGEVVVLGNRDLDWRDRVSPAIRTWVASLPRTASSGPLVFSHGDARLTAALGTSQINRDFLRAWAEMERLDASIWAFGHSHHARVWRKPTAAEPAVQLMEDVVTVEAGQRYFLNVGTTGLPFPGKGEPSVALVDLPGGWIRRLPLPMQPGAPQ
jgi:predicted phosphodiesterase